VVLLTPKQKQIASLLTEGYSDQEMSRLLGISTRAVKRRLELTYKKLEITTGLKRVKLAVWMYERQLCPSHNENSLSVQRTGS
jgi:DNA-binding NarL/FixJ family response regulator